MIIAVPTVTVLRFYRMARTHDYYDAQSVWWHFACTTCGTTGLDIPTRCSHALGALEQGEYHEQKYQCQEGQLLLFGAP